MKYIFALMSGLSVYFAVEFDITLLFYTAVVCALASIDFIVNDN